jgi:hypothetical protein
MLRMMGSTNDRHFSATLSQTFISANTKAIRFSPLHRLWKQDDLFALPQRWDTAEAAFRHLLRTISFVILTSLQHTGPLLFLQPDRSIP